MVHELCDSVLNLYSLEFQDLVTAGLKVGVARTLLATIKSSEHENAGEEIQQQINVPPTPNVDSSVGPPPQKAKMQHENPKVLKLLSLSQGRIIFGRTDPTLTLTSYQQEVNKQAVFLLNENSALASFSGSDVLKHAQLGELHHGRSRHK